MAVGFTTTFTGAADILKRLDMFPDEVTALMKSQYSDAARGTYDESQSNVPVDTGDLKGSASITVNDQGNKWYYEVNYGDVTGGSDTSKSYTYSVPEGSAVARGYAWFTELGHVSRAGNPVPATPYLGPAFYSHAEKLLATLAQMFS